jgi:hypothetical protein
MFVDAQFGYETMDNKLREIKFIFLMTLLSVRNFVRGDL